MGFCDQFAKRSLITLNAIVALAGLACIVGGIVVKYNFADSLQYLSFGEVKTAVDYLGSAPLLFIIFGAVVVLIALCGCCGAYLEKQWLLKVYVAFLLLILVAIVTISALIFAYEASIQMALSLSAVNLLQTYNQTGEVFDLIQAQVRCCGVRSYMDWVDSEAWMNEARRKAAEMQQPLGSYPVPDSCCTVESSSSGPPEDGCGLTHNTTAVTIYADGCVNVVWSLLSDNSEAIAVIGLILAGVVVLCIVFACCVINHADRFGH